MLSAVKREVAIASHDMYHLQQVANSKQYNHIIIMYCIATANVVLCIAIAYVVSCIQAHLGNNLVLVDNNGMICDYNSVTY